MVMQQKTQRPVQFEITEQTRESLLAWIRAASRRSDDYLSSALLRSDSLKAITGCPPSAIKWT
jgi:hypothetical protein